MKKNLSVLFAVLLSLCMLVPSFAASAGTSKQQVSKQAAGAAEYLYSGKTFAMTDAMDLLNLVKAGCDVSAVKESFVQDVEAQLKANGGKLYYPIPVYDDSWTVIGTTDTEELELYAAIIEIYDILGIDYTNVAGYNLADIMTGCGLTACYGTNYYYYRVISEACTIINAPQDFVDSVLSNLTAFYTMGSGPVFWGSVDYVSADDLGAFITALAPYKDTYESYITDAVTVLEKFHTDDGYTGYGAANADSTALALMAYSALGDTEKANEAYSLLCKFESGTTGVFTYDGAEENAYATKDALMSLGYYIDLLEEDTANEPPADEETPAENTDKDETEPEIIEYAGETNLPIPGVPGVLEEETLAEESETEVTKADNAVNPTADITTKENKSKTSPATGAAAQTAAIAALVGAAVVTVIAKRKVK